jgi:hypothetical protein
MRTYYLSHLHAAVIYFFVWYKNELFIFNLATFVIGYFIYIWSHRFNLWIVKQIIHQFYIILYITYMNWVRVAVYFCTKQFITACSTFSMYSLGDFSQTSCETYATPSLSSDMLWLGRGWGYYVLHFVQHAYCFHRHRVIVVDCIVVIVIIIIIIIMQYQLSYTHLEPLYENTVL